MNKRLKLSCLSLFLALVICSCRKRLQERNQGQCIRRVREECKIGDELIFGADLKVVTGLRVPNR